MLFKCRGVDADGPLAKLKNLFFSTDTYKSIREWITVSRVTQQEFLVVSRVYFYVPYMVFIYIFKWVGVASLECLISSATKDKLLQSVWKVKLKS